MIRYFRLYRTFLRFSFMNFTVFRANLINGTIATVGWGIFQLLWVRILTVKTDSAFGWSKNELTVLALLYIIIIGIFHFFFTRNFDRFSRIIDKGELDFLLLKPVDSQFITTCFLSNIPNLFRVLIGVIILVVFINISHMTVTAAGVTGFLVVMLFGIMLLYSLWLMYTTVLIWFPRLTNIIEFLYTINGMARYPVQMMLEVRNFVLLFVLPFSMTVATPVKVFVRGALDGEALMLMLLSVALFIFSRAFWKFALTRYSSASS